MPFVYEDEKYKLVIFGPEDDRSRFVTIRRVYMKTTNFRSSRIRLNEEMVRKRVMDSGEIESIELLPGEKEAFITFISWMGAYNAIHSRDFLAPVILTPAKPWLQPDSRLVLVYDGYKYKWISKDSNYDRTRWFVVRKVHAKVYNGETIHRHQKVIHRDFERFGEIESIELVGQKAAHITFRNCIGAFNAVNEPKRNNHFWRRWLSVEPANTWVQPLTLQQPIIDDIINDDISESEEPPVRHLIGDCLEKVFESCDLDSLMNILEVDKWFNRSATFFGFRRFKTFEIDHFNNYSLAQSRRILKLIGRHITKLKVAVKKDQMRMLHQLHVEKLVGSNLRELEVELSHFSDLGSWQPLLKSLRSLQITSSNVNTLNITHCLQAMCPELIKLVVSRISDFPLSSTHWPTMLHLAVNTHLSDTTLQDFCVFIQNNPQLKCLEFEYNNNLGELQFQRIFQNLTNLEALAISLQCNEAPLLNFSALTTTRLTALKLGLPYSKQVSSNLLSTVKGMGTLRELVILSSYGLADGLRSEILDVIKQLEQLETLTLDLSVADASTIQDVVRFAKKLKYLRVNWRTRTVDDLNLNHVILNACKLYRKRDNLLELSYDRYSCEREARDEDLKHYLSINSQTIPTYFS